jgi:hypothetical protein
MMRRALWIVVWIFPLLVAGAAFKWIPDSELLGPAVIGSGVLGWIGLGFCKFRRLWLKVLVLVGYPVVMLFAITLVMIAVYGVPGLH